MKRIALARLSALLEEHHASVPAPISRDPFQLILWEQVAYLAKDDVRAKAFKELKDRIGLSPATISKAPLSTLAAVARTGGPIAVKERAQRMKRSAELAPTLQDLPSLPLEEARKRLANFPMIGKPGADKVLMMAGLFDAFALESNGLRVLLRVGVAKEGKDYSASYRAVMDAMKDELPSTRNERIALHERLRQHGLNVCKRTKPRCETCSVRSYCAFGPRTS